MSQIGGSYGWFIQLQKQYPTSALVTELVQIHQERFIVKAIVQISGVAIATSMAESTSLETAEDQARLRVLDFLGISVISSTPNLDSIPVTQPLTAPIISDRLPEIPSIPVMQSLDNGFSIEALPNLDVEPIGVPAPLPFPAVSLPATSVDLSMPFSTSLFSKEAMTAEVDSTDETVDDFVEEYLPSAEYGSGYEDEPEDALSEDAPHDPFIEAETAAAIALTEPIQEAAAPSLNSGKPKKAIAEETPVVDNPSDANEPDDLSTLIAHTDIEMDRIGWTKQEGRDYLKRTYKKSTRQRLDVDELMDFLHFLRALPSVNGI